MNWTGTLVTGAGLWDQLDRYDDLNKYVQDEMGTLADEAIEGSRFTPFGVAGYGGNASVDQTGNVSYQYDPTQQAMAQGQAADASQFFASAAMDQSGREQGIYDRIRAMQMPGEERSMMGLESRAQAQGRLGISGANYGGATPEMLAMQTAIAENRNNAAFESIGMARQQQAQDMSLGTQALNNQFLPQAQIQNMMNQGLQASQLQQASQLGGLNLATQLGLGSVQTQVNSEKVRAELMGRLFSTVGGGFNDTGTDPIGSIIESIFGG